MLLLDLRRGESAVFFGAEAKWSTLDGNPLSPTQVIAMTAGKQLIMLLPGYRNDRDAATGMFATMAQGLAELAPARTDVVIVGVLLPLSKLHLGFGFARMRVAKAARILVGALRGIRYSRLILQTHSLGGMVALEALRVGLRCRHLAMAAPAVDDDALEPDSRYGPFLYRVSGRILVAYSRHDPVSWPFRFASWDKMLGCHGPQEPGALPDHVSVLDYSDFIKGHGDYKRSTLWLQALRDLAEQ